MVWKRWISPLERAYMSMAWVVAREEKAATLLSRRLSHAGCTDHEVPR